MRLILFTIQLHLESVTTDSSHNGAEGLSRPRDTCGDAAAVCWCRSGCGSWFRAAMLPICGPWLEVCFLTSIALASVLRHV